MISTILTGLHLLGATILISLAVLIVMGGLRRRDLIAISVLVFIYGVSSLTFSQALNSISISGISLWTVLLIVFTYPIAPAALFVSILVLRPALYQKWFVSIPLLATIIIAILGISLDSLGIVRNIFGQDILISFEILSSTYTGGYLDLNVLLTPAGGSILRMLLFIFYPLNIAFTIIVAIQDWTKDKSINRGAIAIAVTGILGSIASTAFLDSLPATVPALLSNALIAVGYFYLGINLISKGKESDNTWMQNILENHPMFNKMILIFSIVLIPAIIFISYSAYSFFQTSLITAAEENLNSLVRREADSVSHHLDEDLNSVLGLSEANRVNQLLEDRARFYQGKTTTEIETTILENEDKWAADDEVLTSIMLDTYRSYELNALKDDIPSILTLVLVDPYGGLVTASDRPQKYSFIFEDWFGTLKYAAGNSIFTGRAEWSDQYNTYLTTFALPILDDDGSMLGAILVKYDLGPTLSSMDPPSYLDFKYGIATAQGVLFPTSGNPEDQFTIPTLALTPMPEDKSWRTFEFQGIGNLVQTAQIKNETLGFTAPWFITAYQPVERAIAPMGFIRTTTLLVAVIMTLSTAMIVIWFTQSITNPLNKLRSAAEQIQSGARGAVARISSQDEFGMLATSFNQMSEELNQVMTGLEDKIEERTRDLQQRASQLEASAVVARDAAGVQNLSTLLDTVVQLVPEKFSYYHCGIFLLDESEKYAVLQAANSQGGQKMLARGHRLQVGRVGVVGYCAGTGKPRIAQDVGADVTYYANPDMPDTRSEMALPLIVRGQRIGVLDIQSEAANAFSEEDIEILQVLADQLALAIDNTRLLEASQKALDELKVFYGQQASIAWQNRLAADEISYAYDSTGLTRSGTVKTTADRSSASHLTRPISFRGQVIGELDFLRDAEEGSWTEEETQLIEDILEQTALALENARLVQQIRLRSDQIRLLQEITSMAASILNEQELLEKVADKLQSSLQMQHCGIVLREKDPDLFRLATSSTPTESDIVVGNLVNINEDTVSKMMTEHAENLVIHDASREPQYQVFVQTFCTRKKASLILLPLLIRDEVAGYIFLEDDDENRILDAEENDLFNQIIAQISTAVESARLFTAEQQGRMSAAALLEITQIASASLDINQVLNQATTRSAQAINANRCSILLLDEREKISPLVSIDAKGKAMEGQDWERFKTRVKETYRKTPIRTLAANMRQPQIINNLESYRELPLDWAADFDIQCIMSIPLISQNKVIGTMLYTQVDEDKKFQQDQIELAQTIAGQIATTIENANLFEQAVSRAERERQITEITAKIRSSNDPQVIMDTAISELRAALAESTIKAKQAAQKRQPVGTNGKEQEPSK